MSCSIDDRSIALLGEEALQRIQKAKIALFGIGGVGGTAFEALLRLGVKEIHLYDYDVVDESNLNRQILFTKEDLGKRKVDVALKRAQCIRKDVLVVPHFLRISSDFSSDVPFDVMLDAIDDVEGKIHLMEYSASHQIPLILSLGMARRFDPSLVSYSSLEQTGGDPLGKRIRKLARERGLNLSNYLAIYSKEKIRKESGNVLGSYMMVPSSAGLIMAYLAIKTLLKNKE